MGLPELDFTASTALVTGGSSSIGRAIAEELVARGVRQLVLVARTQEKLNKAAEEIKAFTTGLTVRTIQADLASRDALEKVQQEIQGLGWNVDLLVNDAGFGRKYVFGEDFQNDTSLACIDLMVRAVVELSLRFLPGMVE